MKREVQANPLASRHPAERGCGTYQLKGKTSKLTPGYDSYQGILKRVSDMKLSGSLDSEEPSTESEKSECSSYRKGQKYWGISPFEDNSANGSVYGDESSGSSFAGSDHCPPYEEIPTELGPGCRYVRLPQPQHEENYMNLRSHSRECSSDLGSGQHRRISRRSSTSSQYRNSEVFAGEEEAKDGGYRNCDTLCGETPVEEEEEGHSDRITDAEKHQIETFFRGLRTDLFVSSSLANLYVGWKDVEGKWSFKHTGVPVILLDRGDTKSRNKKRIQIMLAERGTCFPLWKDTIDNLSSYRKAGEAFHTMYLSSDHRQIIGLSFDSSFDSDQFYNYVSELTSNPENINISVPGSRKSKKASSRRVHVPPNKDQISNPCLFEHVTSVAAKDKPMYTSLQTLLDVGLVGEKSGEFRRGAGAESSSLSDWRR